MADISEMNQVEEVSGAYSQLIGNIGSLVATARDNIARQINTTMLDAYWQIGQYIVEYEQKGEAKAEYGQGLLERLSRDLTQAYGRGFSRSNLVYMRKFYLAFQIRETVSHKLSWGALLRDSQDR